jgi:hypothetical protein
LRKRDVDDEVGRLVLGGRGSDAHSNVVPQEHVRHPPKCDASVRGGDFGRSTMGMHYYEVLQLPCNLRAGQRWRFHECTPAFDIRRLPDVVRHFMGPRCAHRGFSRRTMHAQMEGLGADPLKTPARTSTPQASTSCATLTTRAAAHCVAKAGLRGASWAASRMEFVLHALLTGSPDAPAKTGHCKSTDFSFSFPSSLIVSTAARSPVVVAPSRFLATWLRGAAIIMTLNGTYQFTDYREWLFENPQNFRPS